MCADIVRPWLVECNESHQMCKLERLREQLLPKRVLDIAYGKVTLVESHGKTGRYVALSHCWGKEQLLITTKDTLAERMRGIKWKELPMTFQDAISITRGLGIRYLWIDSLCIIQRNKRDWEQQSAVMADIYARSYLNLATTRSSSGLEGCLGRRWTSREHEVRSFQVPIKGTDRNIYVRTTLGSSHDAMQTPRWIQDHKESAPLLQRAWVYQERTLSPRTVHMHSSEMIWSCKFRLRCECKALDETPSPSADWSAPKDKIANLSKLSNKHESHGLWRRIIEDYILLDLTHESDRLPALSGLASFFEAQFPASGKYMAGLWEGDLARDLLWECEFNGSNVAIPFRQRHSEPHAPSWSWASLIWGSGYHGILKYEMETKPRSLTLGRRESFTKDPRLQIIHASCSIDGENRHGAVSGGAITLSGEVFTVTTPVTELYPRLNYDTQDLFEGSTVHCLFIGTFVTVYPYKEPSTEYYREPTTEYAGLVLKPSTRVLGAFDRIGTWTTDSTPTSWGGSLKTLELV
jgi:hypothetical protein